mgnify:CR=1 FL=1
MSKLKLYRQRFIPQEKILLKDDIIVSHTEDILITSWKTLNPKTSFSHGSSCYFLKEGIKVSKFYQAVDTLLYYYCDIIEPQYDDADDSLTIVDLLADVIVYPDSTFHVMDLDELAQAQEQGLIDVSQMRSSLYKLNKLLTAIQGGHFNDFIAPLEQHGL